MASVGGDLAAGDPAGHVCDNQCEVLPGLSGFAALPGIRWGAWTPCRHRGARCPPVPGACPAYR